MKLTIRELAKVFDATEEALERWIRKDGLPHQLVHGQYHFHRAEIVEWANQRGVRIVGDPPVSLEPGRSTPSFAAALAVGGVHHDLDAVDRESLLRAMVERTPVADEADRELLFEVLLAREKSGSTGVGDGIAIPHVRSPVVLAVDRPSVTLGFLRQPVELAAIDGKPVHTVFMIVAPTIRIHLSLLARLAAALHDEPFRSAVIARATMESLLALARAAEHRFVGAARDLDFDDAGDGDRTT